MAICLQKGLKIDLKIIKISEIISQKQ